MDVLTSLWLGHFGLSTLATVVADMCESLTATRELACDREGIEDYESTLAAIATAADNVNEALEQIAIIVNYCEVSYGAESTIEAMIAAGAYVEVIEQARAQAQQEAV